ncbi:hypothetical protein [Pseudogulbenkiania ferrooxidans]|uniref:Uncharacterized protein n=1 Tax=Pseudogulbenkiania ferrooxidans 2002 TaxID=279714 RepID=B9Z862_9NEIS|nr:hypothetical protein [Pseudogulbenkiania ferrooxidans]EEG06965.1 conserved hypothetical protein [Pseudogulbenkiania ferrooxidans 2002]
MRTRMHGQLRTNYASSQWERYTLAGLSMALWSVTAVSATATLANSPFKIYETVRDIQPAINRTVYVIGAKPGDSLAATRGDSLLVLNYGPKTVMPSIEVVSDLSLTTGDATLNLKAGDKVIPEARLHDASGHTFYLVLTDPKTSTFLKKYRYFALAETGEVLDRVFSSSSDGYLTREEVKEASGRFTLNLEEKSGQPRCSMSTVFLGQSEGTLRFKLIRSDASGAVNAEQVRSFAAGVRSVSLPGAQLTITKVDAKSIKVHIDSLPPVDCLAGL